MDKEDMIRLAHEAGWKYADGDDGYAPLWKFGQLVAAESAAAEREECAVIAFNAKTYIKAAAAIRARGQE